MGINDQSSFQFLERDYPEVSEHFRFPNEADAVRSIYAVDGQNPKMRGYVLFHFFQKLLARGDLFSNSPVQRIAKEAQQVLNSRPLSTAPQSQMAGANLCYEQRLAAEAARQAFEENRRRMADPIGVIAQEIRKVDGAIFPTGVNQLVAGYAELDPRLQQEIEQALRASQGVLTDELQIRLMELGTRFGDLILFLDLHDIDLSGAPSAHANAWPRKVDVLFDVFPFITTLNLTNCGLRDSVLEMVCKKCQSLETLDISRGSEITVIPPFQALRSLSWNNSRVHVSDMERMSVLPRLERFSLRGGVDDTQIHNDEFLRVLGTKCPNLTHLDLSGVLSVRPWAFTHLGQFANLRELVLTNCTSLQPSDRVELRQRYPGIQIIS